MILLIGGLGYPVDEFYCLGKIGKLKIFRQLAVFYLPFFSSIYFKFISYNR